MITDALPRSARLRRQYEASDAQHTRGFYWRVDELYHLALGTPPEKRKPLVWIQTGTRWRIDWSKLR